MEERRLIYCTYFQDQNVLTRYHFNQRVTTVFEVKTFFVAGRPCDEENAYLHPTYGNISPEPAATYVKRPLLQEVGPPIDTERFALKTSQFGVRQHMAVHFGSMFKDYGMTNDEISEIIRCLEVLSQSGQHEPRGVALYLRLGTCARQGESDDDLRRRAMQPSFLPPLHFYSLDLTNADSVGDAYVENFSIKDIQAYPEVKNVMARMKYRCAICRLRPIARDRITKLPCGNIGHLFHMWVICPTCDDSPIFYETYNFIASRPILRHVPSTGAVLISTVLHHIHLFDGSDEDEGEGDGSDEDDGEGEGGDGDE